jgi:hypothetical protein
VYDEAHSILRVLSGAGFLSVSRASAVPQTARLKFRMAMHSGVCSTSVVGGTLGSGVVGETLGPATAGSEDEVLAKVRLGELHAAKDATATATRNGANVSGRELRVRLVSADTSAIVSCLPSGSVRYYSFQLSVAPKGSTAAGERSTVAGGNHARLRHGEAKRAGEGVGGGWISPYACGLSWYFAMRGRRRLYGPASRATNVMWDDSLNDGNDDVNMGESA